MASVGYAALFIALLTAFYGTLASVLGARSYRAAWIERAENALFAVAGLVAIATAMLLYLLLSRDFQVQYVYAHTSSYQPTLYVLSALWAGQEGSLLLWLLFLSAITVGVLIQKRHWPANLWPYALATLAAIQAFFASMLVTVQNPFVTYPTRPLEGAGLLPALENPGMVVHPPVLFLGYAMYSVPFAFTIAYLVTGRVDKNGLRLVRKWGLEAWLCLGSGILLGAWWAYVELGWGGYWAWDPVESASLLPWLIGTAYLHSLMAQEKKGIFKRWNAALAITAFLLCIFGTLVTRGGIVISDLHGFSRSVQPVAYYLLGFIALVMAVSVVLFVLQRRKLEDEQPLERLLSRESSLLLSNLLLVGLAAAILLGILFPSIVQVLTGTQMHLGSTFYNRVFAPLALSIVFLMGVCPLLGWGKSSPRKLRSLRNAALGAVVLGLALFLLGVRRPLALFVLMLVGLAGVSIVSGFVRQVIVRSRLRGENLWRTAISLLRSDRHRYGGQLVHLSILLIAIGVTGSSLYKREQTVTLARGDSTTVHSYTFRYEDLSVLSATDKQRYVATLGVYLGAVRIGTLRPEKDWYANVQDYVTEVAIRTTLEEDLYVALDWIDKSGLTTFRFNVYPLVVWLWIGGGLLLVGTLVAIWPAASWREKKP